jgi:transposase
VGRAPAKPANEVITDPTLAKAANEVITDLGVVRDPVTGKYRRTRLFVMTLGYSRKSVRLLEFRSSSQIWSELQERAFRRLTGATRVVVLDNLREGVQVDPLIRQLTLYRDFIQDQTKESETGTLSN